MKQDGEYNLTNWQTHKQRYQQQQLQQQQQLVLQEQKQYQLLIYNFQLLQLFELKLKQDGEKN